MDTTAEDISFDLLGRCNFCTAAEKSYKEAVASRGELDGVIQQIKAGGGEYDCLIGLSGGVDSSMVLVRAMQHGLRPLTFSVDNGWNTPESESNIHTLVEHFKVPFFRYRIDKIKFTELQSAFIQSGTRNIEIPTDHILLASTLEVAAKNGIAIVLSGGNEATESIMPPSWGYNARDLVHIKDIYRRFMGKNLTGLPLVSLLKFNWYRWVKGIRFINFLNHFPYNREDAIKELESLGWKSYGDKHCESTFTWWFQNFYLFEKFGIDKRKAHLSSLIVSGQITRDQALEQLGAAIFYPKLGIEDAALNAQVHDYRDYKTDEKLWNRISSIIRTLRKWTS